jgi:hypothetical protein
MEVLLIHSLEGFAYHRFRVHTLVEEVSRKGGIQELSFAYLASNFSRQGNRKAVLDLAYRSSSS